MRGRGGKQRPLHVEKNPSGSGIDGVPYPEIWIIEKFRDSVAGRYMQRAKPRRIELSIPLLAEPAPERRFILLHEIGHWWRREHVPTSQMRYGEEEFANDFARYFVAPKALMAVKPRQYERIDEMIRQHRRQIEGLAARCLAVLKRVAGKTAAA